MEYNDINIPDSEQYHFILDFPDIYRDFMIDAPSFARSVFTFAGVDHITISPIGTDERFYAISVTDKLTRGKMVEIAHGVAYYVFMMLEFANLYGIEKSEMVTPEMLAIRETLGNELASFYETSIKILRHNDVVIQRFLTKHGLTAENG